MLGSYSKGDIMALYTIGEVAQLCDINPVTLRAWQRRYGLLKPQRTDGGHRLFNEADIDRIREIQRWIDTGVQVSKVKTLLCSGTPESLSNWREQQEFVLRLLQEGNINRLRGWLKEHGREYPARTLATQLLIPLRLRLRSPEPALVAMLSLLDGVLINYIAGCLTSARKRAGNDALVVGWNIHDTTRLWIEGWIASQHEWRVDVLAHSLTHFRPELFVGQTVLLWCGECPSMIQIQQLAAWREAGHHVHALGI